MPAQEAEPEDPDAYDKSDEESDGDDKDVEVEEVLGQDIPAPAAPSSGASVSEPPTGMAKPVQIDLIEDSQDPSEALALPPVEKPQMETAATPPESGDNMSLYPKSLNNYI